MDCCSIAKKQKKQTKKNGHSSSFPEFLGPGTVISTSFPEASKPKDGTGREVGGGSGWGTHGHPWLIHVNVWQKPLQCCKVISLQLK